MIALSRALVKRFRLVARRGLPAGRPRGPAPPVRIVAEPGFVTLTTHLVNVVVALRIPTEGPGSGSLTMAMHDLERCEGAGSERVTLEPISAQRARASLQVRDIPTAFEFDLVESVWPWPDEPTEMADVPASFVAALHEAGRSCATDRGKYALERIQVRGKQGQLIASDAKHFLVQGGFTFPFAEDLLVPAVPLFGSKELAREDVVSVGRNDDWFVVGIGPWRVWLKHDSECRYPDVFQVIPKSQGSRVLFAVEDVETLLQFFAALPREENSEPYVTLDIAQELVSLRLRPNEQGDVIEVPLRCSECLGPDTQVVLHREHLGRALALGFREFRVSSPERPVCARDGERVFLAVTLDPRSALPRARSISGASLPAIEAGSLAGSHAEVPTPSPRRVPVPVRSTSSPLAESTNGSADVPADAGFDPVAEAEALRVALTEAAMRAGRLIGWLKQFRKERRALATAYSSLRQLNLSP